MRPCWSISIAAGDIIPADAAMLESSAFTADEAALTGKPSYLVMAELLKTMLFEHLRRKPCPHRLWLKHQ